MKKYLEKLPQEVRGLIKLCGRIASADNMRAYLVGGFVRDLILGVANLDLDIVVEGDGIRFAEKFAAIVGSKVTRHHAFGTATIQSLHHIKIDVATARKETYPQPAQLPVVQPGSLRDDMFRRDFTINAMAIDINPDGFGKLIDFFGGVDDLVHKKVRVMHELSFIDDPTRILRAVRFEKRYGFRIEPVTLKYLRDAAADNMLDAVGPHRVRDELILMLKEKDPIRPLERLYSLNGLAFIKKGVKLSGKNRALLSSVKKEIAWFVKSLPHRRHLDAWLMYFMALTDGLDTRQAQEACVKFGFNKGEEIRVMRFKKFGPRFVRQLQGRSILPSKLFSLLEPLPYEVILLIKAKYRNPVLQVHISEFLKIYNGTRIHVTGSDLMKLGCRPGPHYQEIFKKILRAKLDGQAASHAEELSLACKMVRKHR